MTLDSDLNGDLIKIYNNISKYPSLFDVAKEIGLCERTIQYRIKELRAKGVFLIDRTGKKIKPEEPKKENPPPKIEVKEPEKPDPIAETKVVKENLSLKGQIRVLKEQLNVAQHEALSTDKIVSLIRGFNDFELKDRKDWLGYKNPKKASEQTACLFISDVHFDEYVDPSQIEYVNEYDNEIAVKRLHHTFNSFLEATIIKMPDVKYNGAIVALGGDMLSGNIHEELAESNEACILKSLYDLTSIIIDGIGTIVDEFGKVYVPCVVGNHGRLHKKPRCKNKVQNNFEWLIYQNAAKYFQNDDRVTFEIPNGSDAHFNIYDVNFLLTHGDQFRGGNAIAGIFSALMHGLSKKQKRQSAIRKPFDVMMCGHFHQYTQTNNLIINGSVKGYDEYAYQNNFQFEEPQQAMFLVDPDDGIKMRMPIKCQAKEK